MIGDLVIIFLLLAVVIGLVSQFLPTVLVPVVIATLAGYLLYAILKIRYHSTRQKEYRNEEPIVLTAPEGPPELLPQRKKEKELATLKMFIARNLEKGVSRTTIRNALVHHQWPTYMIERAFSELRRETNLLVT